MEAKHSGSNGSCRASIKASLVTFAIAAAIFPASAGAASVVVTPQVVKPQVVKPQVVTPQPATPNPPPPPPKSTQTSDTSPDPVASSGPPPAPTQAPSPGPRHGTGSGSDDAPIPEKEVPGSEVPGTRYPKGLPAWDSDNCALSCLYKWLDYYEARQSEVWTDSLAGGDEKQQQNAEILMDEQKAIEDTVSEELDVMFDLLEGMPGAGGYDVPGSPSNGGGTPSPPAELVPDAISGVGTFVPRSDDLGSWDFGELAEDLEMISLVAIGEAVAKVFSGSSACSGANLQDKPFYCPQ